MATGVDEKQINVSDQGSFFFVVRIRGENAWLLDAINDDRESFIENLNTQSITFGAKMVVSHAAEEVPMGRLNRTRRDGALAL